MLAFGEELREPCFCLGRGVRARDAASVEAMLARDLRQLFLELGRIGQKSRSA
jgi:hypothetical protein